MSKDYIELEAAKERLRMWITDCILAGTMMRQTVSGAV